MPKSITSSRRGFLAGAGLSAVGGAAASAQTLGDTGSLLISTRRVLLWENTRREFRELIESGRLKAVIVPTGSSEQHNEHLAMIQDTASVTLVAQQAAIPLYPKVLVSTPVPIGISPHWMDRKGTLTLKKETFLVVVYEVCESLVTHGVKSILILNGHGGNVEPLRESTPEWKQKLGIDLRFHSYWDAYTKETIARYMKGGKVPGHAGEFETSFAMAAFPWRVHWEGVDYERMKGKFGIKTAEAAAQDEDFHKDAANASTEKGEAMITAAVRWVSAELEKMCAS